MLKRNIWISPAAWREDHIARLRRVDAAALAAALLLTQLLRFGTDHGRLALGGLTVTYWLVGAVLGVAWWTWLGLRGARDVRLTGHGVEEHRQVLSATLVLFAAMVISFYVLGLPMERGYIALALLLGTALLLAGRSAAAHGLTRHRLAGAAMTRTLVVGREPGVVELVQQLQRHPASGFDPVAVYAPAGARILPRSLAAVQMPPNTLADGHEPSVEGIVTACRRYRIEALVLAASAPLSAEGIRRLSWRLTDERIRLVLAPELTDVAGPRTHLQHLAGLSLVHVSTPRMSRWRMLLKRLVDVVGAACALLALSPVLAVLALVVKRHDSGPVLTAQERTGRDGLPFTMLNFRCVAPDVEECRAALRARSASPGSALFLMRSGPRVTGPGTWMRRHGLDQLPQLVNVLRGEMSLVGPRPPLPSEEVRHDEHVRRRLRLRPGITGPWQIPSRDDLDREQAVRLDLHYVETWSPVQDLLILLRTVKAMVARQGAH